MNGASRSLRPKGYQSRIKTGADWEGTGAGTLGHRSGTRERTAAITLGAWRRRWLLIRRPAAENFWQKLTAHIKGGFRTQGNAQGAPGILGASRARRLPCPRNEGYSDITANSRVRQAPGSVVPSATIVLATAYFQRGQKPDSPDRKYR